MHHGHLLHMATTYDFQFLKTFFLNLGTTNISEVTRMIEVQTKMIELVLYIHT